MKTFKHFIIALLVITSLLSCNNDDDNSPSRTSESIEVIIDNGTPQYYSNNIIATDYNLPPTSGYSCEFKIESEDTSSNQFIFTLGKSTNACPTVISTPSSITLTGAAVTLVTIPGITFDTTTPNSINLTIINFDNTVGGDIDITLNGTYYVVSDPNPHTLDITIDIKRD